MAHSYTYSYTKIPRPLSLSDLRPISVTAILSRLADKLMVNKWVRPSIPSHAIADQFAFRRDGSTTAALVYFVHHVTLFLENKNYIYGVCSLISQRLSILSIMLLLLRN
jgi:hypothetical protein